MIRKSFLRFSATVRPNSSSSRRNNKSKNKHNEVKELKSTINFLTKGSDASSTLSNMLKSTLFNSGDASKDLQTNEKTRDLHAPKDKEEQRHVDTILRVLNSNLPRVKRNTERVQNHYDLFFNQLSNVLENSKFQRDLSLEDNNKILNGDGLYDKFMLLHLIDKLTLNDISRILLNKNFDQYYKLIQNLSMFSDKQQLDISILLYYKTHNEQIFHDYYRKWVKNFDNLQNSTRRILWRGLLYKGGIELINETICLINDWDVSNLVVLYQSLFMNAHKLPNMIDTMEVDKKQLLFIKILRSLSINVNKDIRYKSCMINIVKTSIETKLQNINKSAINSNTTNIQNGYKFTTSLNLILSRLRNENNIPTILQREIADILTNLHKEEQDLQTRIALKLT